MKNKKANLEKKHPNTFIIGFPKCGTTALSNFLGQHPEVYFSPEKETSVYQNSVQRRKISYEKYLTMFEPADLSKHKVIAEGGIRNICTETGISEILRSKPNAKFIVMIRNPLQASISHFLQNSGIEVAKNFEEQWKKNMKDPERKDLNKTHNIFQGRPASLYLYYDKIKRLYDITKFKNVHFIFFEDFKKSNINTFKKLCQFLEIDDSFIPSFKHVNQRSIGKNVVLAKTYNYLSKYTHNIRGHLNLIGLNKKTEKIRKKLGLTNILVTTDPKSIEKAAWHSEKTKQEMLDWFTPDIEKLEKLLDKDLSHWKV